MGTHFAKHLRAWAAQKRADLYKPRIEMIELKAEIHPDDVCVDRMAAAMKAKLADARAKGRGGWQEPGIQQHLSNLLREHVDKGDPRDVANFCAFLWSRGEAIEPKAEPAASEPVAWRVRYRSPDGMIGHYPWAYQDTKPLKSPRPEHEIEPLYNAPCQTSQEALPKPQLGSSCFDGSAAYEAYLDALPSLKTMPDPQWDGDVDEATYKAGWNDCASKTVAALAAILDAPLQSADDKTHE